MRREPPRSRIVLVPWTSPEIDRYARFWSAYRVMYSMAYDAVLRNSPLSVRQWAGAGTVVRKGYFERGIGGGFVTVGRIQQGFVTGPVPPRWVVAVADEAGKEHYVGVERTVREQHEVGDMITKDDPLVEIEVRSTWPMRGGRPVAVR